MQKYNAKRFKSKNILIIQVSLMIYFGSFLLVECDKKSTEPPVISYPDSNLSFIQHIHPIFIENCAFSGCHESIGPVNGLDLETLTPSFNSVNGPVIIPFDANSSRLYRVLLSDFAGISRMPKNRAMLPDAQIKAIQTWIEEGASINR